MFFTTQMRMYFPILQQFRQDSEERASFHLVQRTWTGPSFPQAKCLEDQVKKTLKSVIFSSTTTTCTRLQSCVAMPRTLQILCSGLILSLPHQICVRPELDVAASVPASVSSSSAPNSFSVPQPQDTSDPLLSQLSPYPVVCKAPTVPNPCELGVGSLEPLTNTDN